VPASEGIVLFGDVVESRREGGRSTAWLRALSTRLDAVYADVRLARFDFTQGDELQGLLRLDADPFVAVLHAGTHPDAIPMRWVVVAGAIDPGRGAATRRTGPAFVTARQTLARARARRDDLVAVSGDAAHDVLLDDLAPLLAVLLRELTERQRLVARLVLVDGLRLAEAADRMGVSRATVSVLADRGRVRQIGRLASAVGQLFRDGVAARFGVAS
jgi:DNA-binding NarL/FixJ family response regulator